MSSFPSRPLRPPQLRRAPTLSLMLPFLLGLNAAPAHAGHWQLTVTGSGSALLGSSVRQTFTAPAPAQNSVTIPALVAGGGGISPVSASANLSITVNGVWTADGNSDDTPPPGVWVYENSSAAASGNSSDASGHTTPTVPGSADDGLGDAEDATGNSAGSKYVKESGSSFTVSLSLSASVSQSPGPWYWTGGSPGQGSYMPGTCSAGAKVGPVTIQIHAQPYDFPQTNVTVDDSGDLVFSYEWSSTDGNVADLWQCFFYEVLTYPGGNPYSPPAPFQPFSPPFDNPQTHPGTGLSGYPMTDFTYGHDTQEQWPSSPIYTPQTVIIGQQYKFDDIGTGEAGLPIPGESTYTIRRDITDQGTGGAYWWYDCTKNYATATYRLQ